MKVEDIQFVSCPTEEREPFLWKWTDEGKEVLEDFINEQRAEAVEQFINGLPLNVTLKEGVSCFNMQEMVRAITKVINDSKSNE